VPAPRPDSVLLIAYGGPTRAEEIRPFLDHVLRGKRVPRDRYEEVVRHYEEVGGASPINRLTESQAERLRERLAGEEPALPVYVGMRLWNPFLAATLRTMARDGRRRAIGLILAPHPSHASRESYLEAIEEGRRALGPDAPAVDCPDPFYDHPRFIEALAARVREAGERLPAGRRREARLVATAHSIPVEMARASGYVGALERTAGLLAAAVGRDAFTLAYQSRSGPPQQPWLEPDISDALRELRARGVHDAIVCPIGFVSDHVEVLYDLDIAARATATAIGIGFERAGTVGDHPAFIEMLAALVRDRVAAS
jgi:protoporphyrin/coproporphyrin ferrochelatase